jgi:hypothetical protein
MLGYLVLGASKNSGTFASCHHEEAIGDEAISPLPPGSSVEAAPFVQHEI